MSTTAIHKVAKNDPSLKLFKELKLWVGEYDENARRNAKLMGLIHAHTYQYIRYRVDTGTYKNVRHGVRRLAETLKKRQGTVENWYMTGQFMADHRLKPDETSSSAVRELWWHSRSLSKAEFHRALSAVKKNGPNASREVARIVALSRSARSHSAEVKAERLKAKNELTKTRAKMETMALRTFLEVFFDEEVSVVIFAKGDNKELLRVD